MLSISTVFLVSGYIAFFYMVKLQEHKHMLLASVLSAFSAAIYLILNEAFTGATVSFIAGIASIVQIALGSPSVLGSLKIRNTVAIIFSIVAVLTLYQKPSDLLPCFAFIQNRILEAQASVQLIRCGAFIGAILWAIYAVMNQLYLMSIIEIAISVYALSYLVKSQETFKPTEILSD